LLISHDTALSHRSLLHIKSLLSGVFTYAKRTGVLDSINPMRDVSVPKGTPGKDTYAYSLEEIRTMIRILPEPARTIVTVAAFTGVRKPCHSRHSPSASRLRRTVAWMARFSPWSRD
jgi:hypothetical protein